LSDAADRGITVTEMAAMDQPIDVLRETTAAFVGRALRGPLNEPVLVCGFGEFRRRFGDVWSRSSLGPAVRQFFEHGGKRLYIVRVANNARGAMICLPASGSALVLRAVEPGSTELIRAAVDYDGIQADSDELFNLTLQRIDALSGLVIDQEYFSGVSSAQGSRHFVADMLLTSAMARVESPLPTHRPEETYGANVAFNINYVEHTQEGADGMELSDYDLVGSHKYQEGLFALEKIDQFDVLYLPPPGKHRDLGPTSILAAERFCRGRGAMLVVDPSIDWESPQAAVAGVREQGLASPNLVSYFPRMLLRTEDDAQPRAAGGALAGLMCKLDRNYGAWEKTDQQGLGFSRDLLPSVDVDIAQMQTLFRSGLNVIAKGPAGSSRLHGSVTMSRGSESHRLFSSLPVRRLCLQILKTIDQATRWAVFEPETARLADRIRAQVTAYLSCLADLGAFEDDKFVVECDAGVRKREQGVDHGFAIFVAFHPRESAEPMSFTVHQTVAGSRVASTAFAPGYQGQ
jgi:phage tail sheath protein FI